MRKPDEPCHLEATGRPARTRHNLLLNRLDLLEIMGCEAHGLASSEPSPSSSHTARRPGNVLHLCSSSQDMVDQWSSSYSI